MTAGACRGRTAHSPRLEKALVSSVGPFLPLYTWHFKRWLAAPSPDEVTPRRVGGRVPPFPPVSAGPQPSRKVHPRCIWCLIQNSGALRIKTAGFGAAGESPRE